MKTIRSKMILQIMPAVLLILAISAIVSLRMRTTTSLLVLISALSLLFMAAAILAAARSITQPIAQLRKVADRVAEGDLNVRAAPQPGELGVLANAFNHMISELRDSLDSLRRSEQHFRSLIENASDIIAVLDGEAVVKFVSPAIERVLGYKPDELLGHNILDYIHPDDKQTVLDILSSVLEQDGAKPPVEVRIQHKDGSWRCLETTGCNRLADPSINGIVLNSRDITERKAAERALHESEQRFRAIFENSPYSITISNLSDGTFTMVNPAFERLTGVPSSEALGKTRMDLGIATSYQEDLDYIETLKRYGTLHNAAARSIDRFGAERYVLFSAVVVEIGGEECVMAITLDVTDKHKADEALRASEEQFRQLTQQAPMPIAIYNDQGILEYVNDRFTETFGYTLEDMPDMDHWWSLTCPDEQYREAMRADWREGHEEAMRGGPSIPTREYQAVCKDGSVRFIEVHSARIGHRNLSIISDVTDRKLAEQALAESEEHFRRLTQKSPIPIGILSERDEVTYINEAFTATFGYTLEDVPNVEAWHSLAYPDEGYRLRLMSAWKDATQRDDTEIPSAKGHDYYITCKDGSTRVAEISSTKIGRNRLVLFNDVTARKQAEEALRESTQRLADIINFLPDATFAIDLEGRVIAWNKAVEELTGVTAEEMIGKGDLDYSVAFYGEKKPMLIGLVLAPNEEVERNYPLLVRKDRIVLGEAYSPVLKPSGKYLWGKASPLYNADGNMIGAIESVRDVTDRKLAEQALAESEARFRALFEHASDAVLVVDGMTAVECNQRAVEIYGCDDKSDIVGNSLLNFTPAIQPDGSNTAEKAACHNAEALRGNVQIFTWQNMRKDGTPIDVEVSLNSIKLAGKAYLQTIVRDITERKRVEEEKRQFYRETIRSVTDGKLEISDSAAVEHYMTDASMCQAFENSAQLVQGRKLAEEFCESQNLGGDALGLLMTGVGEAMTNALKHASGGQVFWGVANDELWLGISDTGPGIATLTLPGATLRRGYSTKISMGMGYSIILDVADRVMLSTGPTGTTVVMFKNLKATKPTISLADLQDTWDSIPSPEP